MRLITDKQHAQIVEALSDERYVSRYSQIVEALATLQALPEVEPFEWKHEDIHGDEVGPPTICYATKDKA